MTKHFTLLICLSILVSKAFAQIPNASFENWDSSAGYKTPVAWDNMNSTTTNLGIYTCTRAPGGTDGSYHIELTTHNVSGIGIVPGIAAAGVLDKYDYHHPQPQSGYPYTGRPAYLSGSWQYMVAGLVDQGYISVLLSRWDTVSHTRDTVASASYKMPGMVMLWESFSIPLVYHSADIPDSAIIVLSASGLVPAAGSYLYVDRLEFTDSSIALATGVADIAEIEGVDVYPNPASTILTVKITSNTASVSSIQLIDITGRIMQQQLANQSGTYIFDTGTLSAGTYLIKVQTNTGIVVRKVVIR